MGRMQQDDGEVVARREKAAAAKPQLSRGTMLQTAVRICRGGEMAQGEETETAATMVAQWPAAMRGVAASKREVQGDHGYWKEEQL
ncbi:FAS-associated factor 2-B [Sesbania bispinosa]|nr:FAS-associated factor 2-B [Sesbania bispinosa]